MSVGRRIAGGSSWLFVSQAICFLLQLAYVAVTSRNLTPAAFGIFTVAAAAVTLVSVLVGGGMAQTIMRADDLQEPALNSLVSVAALLGVLGAIVVVLGASPWATIWGNSEADYLVSSAALVAVISPLAALMGGWARRQSRYRGLAIIGVIATLVGCGVGSLLAITFQDPIALVFAIAAGQWTQFVLLQILFRGIGPSWISRDSITHLLFSARVTLSNVLSYLSASIGKFSVSRWLGLEVLGAWNRAESITTGPFFLLQSALAQAIYPELRRLTGRFANSGKLSDLLVIVCWIAVLPAACLAAATPFIVPVLLGPGWSEVIPIAIGMAALGGITTVASGLGSILEVGGAFRQLYFVQIGQIIFQSAVIVLGVATNEVMVIVVGVVICQLLRHIIQLALAHKLRLVRFRTVVLGYSKVSLACVLGASLTWVAFFTAGTPFVSVVGRVAILAGLCCIVLIPLGICWRRLPVVKIMFRYGLIGPRPLLSGQGAPVTITTKQSI